MQDIHLRQSGVAKQKPTYSGQADSGGNYSPHRYQYALQMLPLMRVQSPF